MALALAFSPACGGSAKDGHRESTGEDGGCSNLLGIGFCICEADEELVPPIDRVPECSFETMGGPVACCDSGDTCSCGLFLCSQYLSSSCSCTSVGVGDDGVTSCTGTICCASEGGTCNCGSSTCSGGSVQVPSCTPETARCGPGDVKVDKCAP